ncbi:MAG: hypothetical protein LBR95_09890 [Azoarcus sp.]|nr:hypothetical protein [Azoarcus sp.]
MKPNAQTAQTLRQRYSARFLAMNKRERLMAWTVVSISIVYLASLMWLTPVFERMQKYSQQSAARAEELASLESQMKTLSEYLAGDPDAALLWELDLLESQISGMEERLKPYASAIVNPSHTVTLLKELIQKTPGVRLSGFNKLPVAGLLASRAASKGEPSKALDNDVYEHGFDIKLRGNYLALVAYLRMLESQPERLFWRRAKLGVLTYPESELTLTVYTLSLDRHWLEL